MMIFHLILLVIFDIFFKTNTNRVQLSNPLDALSSAGGGGALTRRVSSHLPLASLQRSMPMHSANDTLPSGVILSFLEHQIIASSVLHSVVEYKHWIIAMVNHLLDKGN